jgi:hypothetical protein
MKTLGFNSVLAVILASALQTRAEQNVSEDNIWDATPVHIADPSSATGNYFANSTNYESQDLSLATNMTFIVNMNVYSNRSGFYRLEPENLGSHQTLMVTIPYTLWAAEPNAPIPGWALSHNKSDYLFSLIDVEVWPLMEGRIQKDLKYQVRIATFEPADQFGSGWQSDGGPGYSTLEPEVGFSWLIRKMGTELSISSGLTLDQEGTTVDYQSGDVFHVDATMAYYLPILGGSAGIGVNGYYLKPLTDDSVSLERLDGFEMHTGGIGPVVFYVRDIGKDQLTFEVKCSPKVNIRNMTIGSFIRIELALIF